MGWEGAWGQPPCRDARGAWCLPAQPHALGMTHGTGGGDPGAGAGHGRAES